MIKLMIMIMKPGAMRWLVTILSLCLIVLMSLCLTMLPHRTVLPNKVTLCVPILYAVIPAPLSAHDAMKTAEDKMREERIPGHVTALRYYPVFGRYRKTSVSRGAYWEMFYKFDERRDPQGTTILVYTNGKMNVFPAE